MKLDRGSTTLWRLWPWHLDFLKNCSKPQIFLLCVGVLVPRTKKLPKSWIWRHWVFKPLTHGLSIPHLKATAIQKRCLKLSPKKFKGGTLEKQVNLLKDLPYLDFNFHSHRASSFFLALSWVYLWSSAGVISFGCFDIKVWRKSWGIESRSVHQLRHKKNVSFLQRNLVAKTLRIQ